MGNFLPHHLERGLFKQQHYQQQQYVSSIDLAVSKSVKASHQRDSLRKGEHFFVISVK